MNGSEEVSLCFIVSRCDCAVELQPGEEILDQMSGFESVTVESSLRRPVGFGRDDGAFSGLRQRFENALVGVISLVCDERIGLHLRQEFICTGKIMRFAAFEAKVERIAQSVDQSVNFGAQPAARSSNGLVFADFF